MARSTAGRAATGAAAVLLSALGQAAHASAQEQVSERFAAVSFLAGCWAGAVGNLSIQEQWTNAMGGMMQYTTRFVRDGAVVDWEFGLLLEEDGGLILWPYPRGSRSEHGFPLVRTEGSLVFENLEHDFPVRIIYGRDGEDGLRPRIEGADGEGREWTLRRVDCPGHR